MINTLLEHVPIKMEVTEDIEESEDQEQQQTDKEIKAKIATKDKVKETRENEEDLEDDSVDEEDDEDEEEEDEEDEEESDTETDALEIEQEAAMLISSDEEAELEAQKIRFPDKPASKKSHLNSVNSSRSSSRNSNKSCNSISSAKCIENTLDVTSKQEPEKKQRISPRLKALDNNANNNSNNNTHTTTTTTTTNTNTLSQNKKRTLETNNNNKNKQQESVSSNKCLQNTNKIPSGCLSIDSVNNKILENKEKENVTKSPGVINSSSATSKSRRSSNNSTCSVASTVASDTAETESCGNIYVFNLQQKLIFNCEFCDLKYGDLDNFGRHLHEAHKLFNFDEDQEKENAPRNMRKSPRYSNSNNKPCDSFKKEPLQSLESLTETPPVALPLSVLAEPLNSCGNVFMLNHRKLFLVCGYCECKYANLDLFEKHLRQQHRIFEGHCNEVNVVPKIEIKEEDVSITEVIPTTQDLIIPQAMVSIPAEIPLDISINPENLHLTEKALEEVKNSNKQINNDTEIAAADVKEIDCSNTSNQKITTAVVLPTVVENNKNMNTTKNKNKRKSSPTKPSTSPNKRPKRNTRNTETKSQEKDETSTPMEIEEVSELIVTSGGEPTPEEQSPIEKSSQNIKSKDTKKPRKSLRSTETKKSTNSTTSKEPKESLKDIKETNEADKNEIKENEIKEVIEVKESKKKEIKERKENNKKAIKENKTKEVKEITIENNEKEVKEHNRKEVKEIKQTKENNKKDVKETMESNKKDEKATNEINKKELKESNKKQLKDTKETPTKEQKTIAKQTKETKKSMENEVSNTPVKAAKNEDVKKTKEAGVVQENVRQLRERRKSKVVVEDNNEKQNKKPAEKSKKETTTKEQIKKSTAIEESLKTAETEEQNEPKEMETQSVGKEGELNAEPELLKRKNECSDCGKKCRNKTELARHERTHIGQRPFSCSYCDKEFIRKYQLVLHERLHTGVTPYVCKICKRCFSQESSLQTHNEKLHSHEKHYFTCEICQRDFTTEYLVYNHIEKEHGDKMLQLEDAIRDDDRLDDDDDDNDNEVEKITNETELVHQMLVKEAVVLPEGTTISAIVETPQNEVIENALRVAELPTQQDVQITQDADLAADTDPVNDIMEQLQNEYVQNEREERNAVTFTIKTMPDSMTLNISNKSPASPTSILPDSLPNDCTSPQDIKPVIKQIVKRFFCDQCPRSFEKHIRLVEHKRIHTGEKPYTCDECGKQFRIRMRLNEHKQRHAKEKKFNCQMCSLSCSTRNDLILHMRHHTNDRRFQCSMCPKAFVRGSDLKIHVRIHTGEKPYVCDICHKCFRANQNLSVHKKSHMGEASKSFQCEMCDKKFMRKIDRKVHMRSHTGEKPFKCEICDRGYSSRFNVRAHIERDHMSGNSKEETASKKRKPGPKPKALREELEKQKQLIAELQHHLLQQIKTDEKIIPCDGDFQIEDSLQDNSITPTSPTTTKIKIDPVQSAYELLNKLKTVNTSNSKPLTIIPSPVLPLTEPPTFEPVNKVPTTSSSSSSNLIPLTLAQKIEQHSPASSPASSLISNPGSCLTTPSPPKATTTKVMSQKTSLGIQQVSVTVSMQVENVTTANTPSTPEKENDSASVSGKSVAPGTSSVKKERKITSYFTVLGQKGEA